MAWPLESGKPPCDDSRVSSQHRFTNRNYRPADDEYEPVRKDIEAAGYSMTVLIRAWLRRFKDNPQAEIAALSDYLSAVVAETPRGRPRKATKSNVRESD